MRDDSQTGCAGVVGGFKIGSRLFTSHGPRFVEELVGRGDRVFLDLKFHDIPNTVAGAVGAATRLGVWMVNVHASGGLDMMRAAREAADEEAAKVLQSPPLVIAVTVLTSLERDRRWPTSGWLKVLAITSNGWPPWRRQPRSTVSSRRRGKSPLIRAQCGERFAVVTPGIRGLADLKGDQTRTESAQAALEAGASFIVVGRPIIAAPDPRAAAEAIANECRGVMRPTLGG